MLKVDAVKPETPAARKGVKAGLWLQSVVYTRDGQHFELKTWGAVPLSSLISVIRECRPISLRFGRMEPPPPPTACETRGKSLPVPTDVEQLQAALPTPPAGWVVEWHEEYERYYYHHEEAQISTWQPPNRANGIVDADVTETVPLPPVGWGLAWSEGHQCWFWWNLETEVVVLLGDRRRTHPEAAAQNADGTAAAGAAAASSAAAAEMQAAGDAMAKAAAAAAAFDPTVHAHTQAQQARARAHAAIEAAMASLPP